MVAEDQQERGRVPAGVAVPGELPIIAVGENMVFPSMVVPLATDKQSVVQLIDAALSDNKVVGILAQRTVGERPTATDLYSVGSAALISRMFKIPDGSVRVFLQGLARSRLVDITQADPYLKGRVGVVEEVVEATTELEALGRNLLALFQRVVEIAPNLPDELGVAAVNIPEPGNLADFVAAHIGLKQGERQEILETLDVAQRIKKLTEYINRELEILELGTKIQSQIKGEMDKAQREFYLREQLKAIQKELGEVDERSVEANA